MDIDLRFGDNRAIMATMSDNSVDSVVCDPPYELTSARPGGRSPATQGKVMKGFMGLTWDATGIANDPAMWAEVMRVLKPGGHLLAFSHARTYHRMVCAIEDAGFEVRDQIMWIYGQGMPKNNSTLKPAHEPICMARKPFTGTMAANVAKWGTGSINVEACRVGPGHDGANRQDDARRYEGVGFHATPGTRGGTQAGRHPANLIHDGTVLFPDAAGQQGALTGDEGSTRTGAVYGSMNRGRTYEPRQDDTTSAARFFYCAKATRADRNSGAENTHPTVKPEALMRYLVKLVTPAGGRVFDPFMGSGSTGKACVLEGFNFIGADNNPEYVMIAAARIGHAGR